MPITALNRSLNEALTHCTSIDAIDVYNVGRVVFGRIDSQLGCVTPTQIVQCFGFSQCHPPTALSIARSAAAPKFPDEVA
jgi:hypothetical protein